MRYRLPVLLVAASLAVLGPAIAAADPAATGPAAPKKSSGPAKPAAAPAKPADPATAPPAPNNGNLGLSASTGPTTIDADDGIEMQQSNKVYIAHGNAVAKRGDRSLFGDTLMAFYRDLPNSDQTEIWRVVADGHVRLTTPTETVVGDHGVYDLDTKIAVITGKHLQMTTPQDVVTARDSLEWYDDKQFAIARGNAVGTRLDRRIRADVLTAQMSQAPGEAARISIANGTGHVIVSRPDEIGTGDRGVYDVDKGIVTLFGHVTLARGENTMRGEYGVLNMQTGMSRLLPRPPGGADGTRGRVEGYIVPRKKAADAGAAGSGDHATVGTAGQPHAANLAPATPPALPAAPAGSQKSQTNASNPP